MEGPDGGSHSWNTEFPHYDIEINITMKNFILFVFMLSSEKTIIQKKYDNSLH